MSSNAVEHDTDASRRRLKIPLDTEIGKCRRCDGMNIPGVTASAPGYGCLTSPVALVGQSLCEKCMDSQVPFTGGSGDLINEAIKLAGLKKKRDVFISNAVHCHPPKNRASHQHEIVNCSTFLHRELEIVRPRLVITLGRDAERVVRFFYPGARFVEPPFVPPRGRLPRSAPIVFQAQHPSWVKRQHDDQREKRYTQDLAAAIRWSFDEPITGE
ncbi:uracil-DNA glycosylase family protein [Mycobacteroides abscessus]|uniref:uracil-DNA glycosylase family protein n=1 Tax=Mycobacteroides abscessus TaxID=36809 RepID=UPI00070F519E|nr:uracil-DNA glycosylase family protein [Mycobacteroides abscessus]ALM19124.1 uracil-DNA glycosylase [Mycobacteroides abscessus]AMU49410.1 uracil-DNA glycosylase [Mycobacteroides abscessus]ANO08082.1 uracil-DNA glycosylase [Mycobacteroides abscessus]MDM3921146.1 uracil-DNA glycosylase family protein [Mycobacteroides abscessus]MDO2965013.1 uracil-DNA glycosylase family protein [Mycobacteroides abscessus subsp. abscessus]